MSRSNKNAVVLEELIDATPELAGLSIMDRTGEGWSGVAVTLPPQPGSDVFLGLDIEHVGNEITISFDHCHLHLDWPPQSGGPNALTVIADILSEKLAATSGWIGGCVRVGSLKVVDHQPELLVPGLQHLRVRSWRGTFNRDEQLDVSSV
jgi:hypothetical protein